jgi:hypothetical protein
VPAFNRPPLAPCRETARALPFPLAPWPAETTVSFLRRLAAAHTVPLQAITSLVGFGPNQHLAKNGDLALTPSAWERLAVMTGRTPAVLARALRPATPPPRAAAHPEIPRLIATVPHDRYLATACRPCLTEHGIPDQDIPIWLDAVTHLCPRHHTWLRESQLDSTTLPELTRAQRRHRRLAARHSPDHLAASWAAALSITDGWRHSPFHPMAVRFRTRSERLATANHGATVPDTATTYPETVHLAAMIADPGWHTAACGGRHDQERFLREANQRLDADDLHHADTADPLLAWLRLRSGHRGRPMADPRRSSPLLNSPPLRIAGWTQTQADSPHRPRQRARMSRTHMAALRAQPKTDENKPLR